MVPMAWSRDDHIMWGDLGRVQPAVSEASEKFDSPPYSEWMAVSKMAASIGGGHLQ